MSRLITKSYQVVTPESAEIGDYDETGWEDEDGRPIEPDEFDVDEHGEFEAIVRDAVSYIQESGNVEASSTRFHTGIWYTTIDAENEDGTSTTYSFHLNGFLPEEEEAIFNRLK